MLVETQLSDTIGGMLSDPSVWLLNSPPAISALIRAQVAADQMASLVRGVPDEYLSLVRDSVIFRREFAAAQTARAEFKALAGCRD